MERTLYNKIKREYTPASYYRINRKALIYVIAEKNNLLIA